MNRKHRKVSNDQHCENSIIVCEEAASFFTFKGEHARYHSVWCVLDTWYMNFEKIHKGFICTRNLKGTL